MLLLLFVAMSNDALIYFKQLNDHLKVLITFFAGGQSKGHRFWQIVELSAEFECRLSLVPIIRVRIN